MVGMTVGDEHVVTVLPLKGSLLQLPQDTVAAPCIRQEQAAVFHLQIKAGVEKFDKKIGDKFIIYFQAFTNTYAPVEELRRRYDTARAELTRTSREVKTLRLMRTALEARVAAPCEVEVGA